MIYFVFVLLWIITFFPAWYLLLKLVAISSSKVKLLSVNFILTFFLYQIIIVLPYVYLLVFGQENLPGIIRYLAISAVFVGICISTVRLFLSKQVNQLLWSVYGRIYDGLLDFYPYVHLQKLVAKTVNPKSNMNILDLGCGTGNQSMLLGLGASHITAVDNSESMLRQFKRKIKKNNISNVEIIRSDLIDFITTNSVEFDKIVLVNVLYTTNDRELLINEMLRSLKPNGEIIVTNSDTGGNGTLIKEHIRNRGALSLLKPRLIGVFIIDSLISELAKTGHFSFVSQETVQSEVEQAGGSYEHLGRCYGDVNILFRVTKK